jgi:hypothetical protein
VSAGNGAWLEELEEAFAAREAELPALRHALAQLLEPGARVIGCERCGPRVQRLQVESHGAQRSLVVKELDPVVAQRNRMLAERWLPAAGLEALGPGLIATAADPQGRRAWQVYEDWGDAGLDRSPGDLERVRAAVRAVAELHLRFADHALLGECRLWTRDLGMPFYSASVRDALRALGAAAPAVVELPDPAAAARERLLSQLRLLRDQEGERARALEALGGPETLVHGDLWAENVFVRPMRGRLEVRLIDWDRVGVAPFAYDLSTLLLRLPAALRPEILAEYDAVVSLRGWRLPDAHDLNGLCDTAERARIASLAIWPALALLRREEPQRDWALGRISELCHWLDALEPLLPVARSAVA